MPHCIDTHEGDWPEKRRPAKKRSAAITGLRLTDAELEAIDAGAHALAQLYVGPTGVGMAATLRGLLDRLGHQ